MSSRPYQNGRPKMSVTLAGCNYAARTNSCGLHSLDRELDARGPHSAFLPGLLGWEWDEAVKAKWVF